MNFEFLRLQRRPMLALAAVTLCMIYLYGQIDYTIDPYNRWDLFHYRQIAAAAPELASGVQQPFAYRVLGPYLAGLLPGPDPLGFQVLTILTSLLLILSLYVFLCRWPISRGAAFVTTLLFVFNKHLFGFNVWDYFQINDVLSLLYLVVLFWALPARRWPAFGATLFLAALTRETALVMIIVGFVYLLERGRWRAERRAFLAAVLPALACFVLLRLLIVPTGGQSPFGFFVRSVPKFSSPETWFRLLVNPFIPLAFLPLLFPAHTLNFFRRNQYMLVYLILIFASTALGYDNERLMAPAFVVFYLLTATIIDQELVAGPWLTGVLLLGGFLASFQHLIGRFPLPDRSYTTVLSLGSLLCVTIAAHLARAPARLVAQPEATAQ